MIKQIKKIARPFLEPILRPVIDILRRWKEENLNHMEFKHFSRISFSQFGEDIFVDQYFAGKTDGVYVDIGAYHPMYISNSYLLYKKGWRGICIEPHPEHYVEFPQYRPRDLNLNLAVSTTEGIVKFRCDSVYSGISDNTHLFPSRNPHAQTIEVRARTLSSILDEHLLSVGGEIDFLSVDCEGHDMEVLRSNNWDKYRPKLVLVEHHISSNINSPASYLALHGYHFLTRLGLTEVFEYKCKSL